jgi:hypothetical protein
MAVTTTERAYRQTDAPTGLRITELNILVNPHITARRFSAEEGPIYQANTRTRLFNVLQILFNTLAGRAAIFDEDEGLQIEHAGVALITTEVGHVTGFIHATVNWTILHRVYFPAQGTYQGPKYMWDHRRGHKKWVPHSEWIGRERTGMGLDIVKMQRRMKMWLDTQTFEGIGEVGSWFVGATLVRNPGRNIMYNFKQVLEAWRHEHDIAGKQEDIPHGLGLWRRAGRSDVIFPAGENGREAGRGDIPTRLQAAANIQREERVGLAPEHNEEGDLLQRQLRDALGF